MVAGGYCHNNPEASCQQLRLSSTVFYDVAAGEEQENEIRNFDVVVNF
jgi:hypothetical protein